MCTPLVKNPKSTGMGEAFVKTFKRDDVQFSGLPDANAVFRVLPRWFEDYNENHPHKGSKMVSPESSVGLIRGFTVSGFIEATIDRQDLLDLACRNPLAVEPGRRRFQCLRFSDIRRNQSRPKGHRFSCPARPLESEPKSLQSPLESPAPADTRFGSPLGGLPLLELPKEFRQFRLKGRFDQFPGSHPQMFSQWI